MLALVEFVMSGAIRQHQRSTVIKQTLEAELTQEPYRGTAWGRAYWEELALLEARWDPYLVYREATIRGQFINIIDGVRNTYAPRAEATASKRPLVFVFGGSGAWGHGARDAETLPSWLARVAEARGTPLDVRNYAESGWVNWQCIAYLLRKLAEGERPNLVIFDSGVNEVLGGARWPQEWRPIWDPDYYVNAMDEHELRTRRPLLAAWDSYRATSLTLATLFPPPSSSISTTPPRPVVLARKIAAEYGQDVSVVEALGREYGFATLFVWQPIVADKKTLTAQERNYVGWLPLAPESARGQARWAGRAGLLSKHLKDLYEEVGGELIYRGHVMQLSNVFDGMTTSAFIDWMHPSESGNERIATALYEQVRSRVFTRRSTQ